MQASRHSTERGQVSYIIILKINLKIKLKLEWFAKDKKHLSVLFFTTLVKLIWGTF